MRAKEVVTGIEREVQQGSAILIVPGYGISEAIQVSIAQANRWWEGTAKSGQNDSAAWIEYIKSGQTFKVIFDKTRDKFDDSQYTGDYRTDPMGTLKGGETYTVVYKNGGFVVTGYNQGTGGVGTWTYSNADPVKNQISLWGSDIYI